MLKCRCLTLVTVNIEGENLHIFWTTRRISMKFSGNMGIIIISKVPKKQLQPLSKKAFLEKNAWGGGVVKLILPSLFRVNWLLKEDVIISIKYASNIFSRCSWQNKVVLCIFWVLIYPFPSDFFHFVQSCLYSHHCTHSSVNNAAIIQNIINSYWTRRWWI